jgi:hypothetical protein
MLDKGRKYPKDYKPNIYTVNFLLKYYEKKYHDRLMNKSTASKFKKYIKTIDVKNELIVLDDNMAFPTKNMKAKLFERMWKKFNIKTKIEDSNIGIRDIKIIHHHGHVSYEFDETKH